MPTNAGSTSTTGTNGVGRTRATRKTSPFARPWNASSLSSGFKGSLRAYIYRCSRCGSSPKSQSSTSSSLLDLEQLHTWGDTHDAVVIELRRAYADRIVKKRLHQPVFRAQVLAAYENRCALCRLRHRALLDAAHIRNDSLGGEPVVTNGIAMCKIHHAAFDTMLMAVRPDYAIEVRPDVLVEEDGPTLTYALQGLHDGRIELPRQRAARPNRELLAERYEQFRMAG